MELCQARRPLVAGARAQFKGTGTINGAGDYGFLLTGIDGQATGGDGTDKFRITIWDRVAGTIVYENQAGQPDSGDAATELGGGSIVIHKQRMWFAPGLAGEADTSRATPRRRRGDPARLVRSRSVQKLDLLQTARLAAPVTVGFPAIVPTGNPI